MGFKKRIISLLLAASMIVSICPISALGTVTVSNDIVTTEPVQSVYAVDANNLTAGAFTYTVLDETSCQITGYTGTDIEITVPSEIDGYTVRGIGVDAFRDNTTVTAVVISDGIETIGKNAFSGCISLTDVALPDTLTAIHSYAFQDCPFEKIDIPDSVTEMSARAFYNCTNLSEIGYPAGWTTVLSLWNSTTNEGNFDARSPFEGCTSLKEITVDEGVTKIPAHAFWGVTGLETVILPESLSSIGSYAFSDCTELSQINLHENLTEISKYSFQNCKGLKSVTIPESITVISEGLFSGCTGLSEVKLHDNMTAIHSYAFQDCPFEKIDIPDSVTEMSSRAFYNCTNLHEISYPAGWTTVLSLWNSTTNEGNFDARSPFEGCTSLKEITVDEGVTKIPTHAFWGVTGLETVILPESLSSIGSYAFSDCTELSQINLHESLTSVGKYVFQNCSGLKSITIPQNITVISEGLFSGCTGLSEVKLHDNITAIHSYAFQNCPFEKIDIPDSVTEISARAFYNCTNLHEISYPAGWTTVLSLWNSTTNEGNFDARSPFEDCTSLKEITVDEGVTKIPAHAFWGVTGLEKVILPESLSSIGSYAFSDCTELSQINLHESLTEISKYSFQNCKGLKSVTIPESITVISEGLFSGCTGLSEVKLHDNITAIHSYAFQSCPFEKIDIPDSVTEISARAFYNCTNLREVSYPAGWITVLSLWNSTTNEGNTNAKSPFEGCTSLKEITVDEGVTKIPAHAFWGVTGLEAVILPESLSSIGGYAFSDCTELSQINLPESLTSIGKYVFQNCSGLNTVTIPQKITVISEGSFSGCTGLSEVKLRDNITAIHSYAFQNCPFEKIDIPDSVTEISARAFYNCTNLSEIGYPAGWTTVLSIWNSTTNEGNLNAKSPFEGCTSLKEITVDEGVTKIPSHAFWGVTELETVILPKSLTSIGGYAFSGCTNLKSVNLVEGITEISSHGFAECISMNNLILPDSLETVGEYAFYKCSGLRSINMGIGLKAVKRYAFYGCHGITDLSFGGNVEEISDYAFAECINLNSVSLPSKLKTIGKAAFANCVNVSELNVPNPVISIGDDAFNGLDDLTFYCSINSYAATYAIDHNIPIIDTEENTADSNYIDSQNSYYRVNGDGVSASGYLSMVAKYGFVDSASVTDISLTFNIPAVVELDESSLTVDGVLCTNYEFKDNMLTVPVTNTGGVVRFLLKPLSYDKVTAYCKVSFNDGTSRHTEILGTVYTEIPILSITSPSQTSGTSVRVNGVTIPNSNVIIYVNGAKCTTVRSNRVGDYSANVQLTSPVNGKRYTVRAEAVDSNGVAITAETSTVYRDSVPKLEAFIMEYGGKTYNLHELAGTKPNVTWSASYRFKFTVKFENAESVSSVYIVSTRNNVKKYMEAKWNENAQAFVAEGYFDSNSHYIPGEISVQYVRNSGKVSFEEGFDFASDEVYNNLPQSWKDATITINENTDTKTDIIVDCPEDSEDMMDYALRYITEIHNIGSGYSESDAIADGYIKITDDYGKTIYYMQDCDSDSIKISTIDFGGEKDSIDVVDITIDLMTGFLDDDGDKYFESAGDVIDIIGFAGDTLDTLSDAAKIDEIKKQIQNSNMSPEEKARALEEVRRAQIANTASYLGKAALFAAGATASLSGPWGLAAAVSFMILDDLIDMWDEYFMERLLSMKFKWAIDPSGIIYDLRTGKPIVNATVTVYCVLYDENDSEFWNNKPSTDEYGELWDASEFSQQNPLQTDISGWYAWDVPEGWWRVKSEKSGYETAWSEWLPVPPPQLDVNIGMVPNAAVLGDVNNDMEINLDDVIALLRHVSKALIITDESSLSAGDVVADGKLNMDDVIKLLRYVSKAIPDLN